MEQPNPFTKEWFHQQWGRVVIAIGGGRGLDELALILAEVARERYDTGYAEGQKSPVESFALEELDRLQPVLQTLHKHAGCIRDPEVHLTAIRDAYDLYVANKPSRGHRAQKGTKDTV